MTFGRLVIRKSSCPELEPKWFHDIRLGKATKDTIYMIGFFSWLMYYK